MNKNIFPLSLRVLIAMAFILGLSPLVPPQPVYAAARYISPTGDDSGPNNCLSELTPCQTIVHAISQATSGDIVYLAAGVHRTRHHR